jgi:hypothetical protein
MTTDSIAVSISIFFITDFFLINGDFTNRHPKLNLTHNFNFFGIKIELFNKIGESALALPVLFVEGFDRGTFLLQH